MVKSLLKSWFTPWRAYLAEFLGTFVFVFIASGATLTNIFFNDIGGVGVALATGLALTSMIYAVVHLSGGHLNPAVTLAIWFSQKINGGVASFYIIAQLLASLAAAGVLLWIFGPDARQFSLGGPVIGAGVSIKIAVVIEAILTAILVLAVFATMVDKRGAVSFGPLVVGLVLTVSAIFAGSLTGAALNPARAFGPLIISQSYSNLAVWIIGPATGSIFGLIYDFLFLRKSARAR
ncbi:hypothetical protein A2W70_03185 [Candidatus Curtissbacteria bacterium RIFCSPLOWO2_02_41_11]|uniref:Aquaporin n=1 Tax=Candidatus Curtissbacteria bacterium RIFCSPLOWO2_02_41_11 TaxID=1797731 RepID=A0A1F5HT48_9BACT|nr:MAG: hypothetical protein A2W70_03185 [Candidatus Curtissbacteria bacterium RIFCSPLOWO2_02_41_11]